MCMALRHDSVLTICASSRRPGRRCCARGDVQLLTGYRLLGRVLGAVEALRLFILHPLLPLLHPSSSSLFIIVPSLHIWRQGPSQSRAHTRVPRPSRNPRREYVDLFIICHVQACMHRRWMLCNARVAFRKLSGFAEEARVTRGTK